MVFIGNFPIGGTGLEFAVLLGASESLRSSRSFLTKILQRSTSRELAAEKALRIRNESKLIWPACQPALTGPVSH